MKNMDKKINLEDARRRYKKFLKVNDFRDVKENFIIGLEAQVFVRDGKILGKDDDLFFGFFTDKYGKVILDQTKAHTAVYQYTFRRQPVKHDTKVLSKEQILQQLQEQGML